MTEITLIDRSALKRPDFAACFVQEGSGPLQGLPWTDPRLADLARSEKFSGQKDQVLAYQGTGMQPKLLMVFGLGKRQDAPAERLSAENAEMLETLRQAANRAARAAREHRAAEAVMVLPRDPRPFQAKDLAGALAEGVWLGLYKDRRYLTKPEDKTDPRVRLLAAGPAADLKGTLERARIVCQSVNLVRDLVNTPASDLTPKDFARLAARTLKGARRVKIKAYDRRGLEALKMGGLLGVSRGSDKPPAFLHLHYKPAGRPRKKVTLVGKGITFDSGGLSLKPANSMEDMKGDMAGAATVVAVMLAASRLNLPVEIHGVAALTENMPGPGALKPGDVLRSMSGKTIEVLNTDAEGRLILADALFYGAGLKSDVMIDLATLTGAAIVALGMECTALMGDQKTVDALRRAGEAAGEKSWQLPLIAEYREHMKSRLADIKNIGKSGQAGTIIGGLFLKEFAGEKPWVHMDIAGPSFYSSETGYQPQGGTGIPVRTLVRYLENL
jgi:leucyl aminopeptidase